MKIFEQNLNCTPPLLATEPDQMCNERFNDESERIFELFMNNYIDFEPSDCKTPCTQTRYKIHSNEKAEQKELVIKLTFKPFVYVSRSLYSTTVVDVITSLGGSVRNFFCWNIIENF